ncbi:GL20345, partial [Drosophila persimilis]
IIPRRKLKQPPVCLRNLNLIQETNCSAFPILANISSASSNSHDPSSPMRKRNDKKEHSEGAYKCPVCLEIVRHREPLLAKCGHVFCRQCIETVIRSSHKCPMCNMKQGIRDTMRIYL